MRAVRALWKVLCVDIEGGTRSKVGLAVEVDALETLISVKSGRGSSMLWHSLDSMAGGNVGSILSEVVESLRMGVRGSGSGLRILDDIL